MFAREHGGEAALVPRVQVVAQEAFGLLANSGDLDLLERRAAAKKPPAFRICVLRSFLIVSTSFRKILSRFEMDIMLRPARSFLLAPSASFSEIDLVPSRFGRGSPKSTSKNFFASVLQPDR